jgi:sulfur-carrier protein
MSVTVRIPTPLRKLTANQEEVQIEGGTVGEVLKNLDAAHPGIGERLLEPDGGVRKFVNLYVNDEDVRFLQNTDTQLKDGDELSIIPAIAGGR